MAFMDFMYKRWARGIAKAQVRSLRNVRRGLPDAPNSECYTLAIAARAGISDYLATGLVESAYKLAEQAGTPEDVFRYVTLSVCNFDHNRRMGRDHIPIGHVMDVVYSAICEVVPSGI